MSMPVWESVALKLADTHQINDIITKVELGKINWKTLQALTDREILTKVDENNFRFTSIYTKAVKVKKSTTSSSSHNKTNNQDFGKYFEYCISERTKNVTVPPEWEHYNFSDKTRNEVFDDAQYVLPLLPQGQIAHWVGNHTVSGNGDLVMDDGTIIEVKYLQNNSSGTYFNPSIYNLKKFGFDFKDYLNEAKYYDLLESLFGHDNQVRVSRKNCSPFNGDESEYIRAAYPEEWANIVYPAMELIIEKLTDELFEYLAADQNNLLNFLHFILNKSGNKTMPDKLISFNYHKKEAHIIDVKEVANGLQTLNLRKTDKGFTIDETIRIQLSWKNGYGLYNPAMYVYINKK